MRNQDPIEHLFEISGQRLGEPAWGQKMARLPEGNEARFRADAGFERTYAALALRIE
jgi:hypothetical protein